MTPNGHNVAHHIRDSFVGPTSPLWGAFLLNPSHKDFPYVALAVQQVMVYSAYTTPTIASLGRRPPLCGGRFTSEPNGFVLVFCPSAWV